MSYAIGILVIVGLVCLFGCERVLGRFASTKVENKPMVTEPKKGKKIILSQDFHDEDNYPLIVQALELHDKDIINLLAIDITGIDIDGKASKIFSILLKGRVDIPIFINHNRSSRETATSRNYRSLDKFPNDGKLDKDRIDSTIGLTNTLLKNEDVTYVVGGHLTNFESLLRVSPSLVSSKIREVVISSGWSMTDRYIKETNLAKDNDAITATEFVFSHLPNNIILTMCSTLDTESEYNIKLLDLSGGFKYLVQNGTYYALKGCKTTLGDFQALLHGSVATDWYGNKLHKIKGTKFTTKDGMVKANGNHTNTNHKLLTHPNRAIYKAIFEELIKGK